MNTMTHPFIEYADLLRDALRDNDRRQREGSINPTVLAWMRQYGDIDAAIAAMREEARYMRDLARRDDDWYLEWTGRHAPAYR